MLPTRLQVLAIDAEPPCHDFANACVCPRCSDRALRSRTFHAAGLVDPAELAKQESAEYFRTPWRFDNDEPPRPLDNTR